MATTSYGTPYVQSSDLVSGWPTASLNVANRIDEVSYAGNGINAQTGTTYTLVVGDAGKTVTLSNAAAVAVTLPQDSVANLPTGAVVNFYNLGAGTVTISAGAGATLQGGSLTAAQYGYAAVIKLSANNYGPYQPVPTTPGLAIITPTSIANSGGTASASGGAVTFTTVNSVSLNGVFSSTYDNYRVLVRLIGSTSALPSLRLRVSGSDATGANYEYQYLQASATTVSSARTTGATSLEIATISSNDYGFVTFDMASPGLAATTQISMISTQFSTVIINGSYAGRHTLSTAYDGLTLLANTGTCTGIIRVYGYKNS